MSDYGISTAAIVRRLGEQRVLELTDDANTGAINDANVEEGILAAEAELHLYAGVYYATPLRMADGVSTPVGIKEILTDAACWRVMTRRSQFLRGDDDEGAYWQKRRDEWLDFLAAIAASSPTKRLLLPGAVEAAASSSPRGGSASLASDDVFFTGSKGYF